MKKEYCITIVLMMIISIELSGQIIKVDNNGQIILKPFNMSKSILITEDYDEPQILPSVSGYGYIGTNSQFWFRVATRYISRTYEQNLSDITVKENIKPLKNSLNTLMKINGIQFDFKEEAFKNDPKEKRDKLVEYGRNSYGFTAQNLMEVYPNLVKKEDDGLLYINSEGLIPVLVEAVKEQQTQIETLQQVVVLHEQELINIKKQITELSRNNSKTKSTEDIIAIENLSTGETTLYQNTPNPFTLDTKIEYFVPDAVSKARIIIHNLNGKEIKIIEITSKGAGSVTIQGSELEPGMYLYSLVADNNIIDTKRMILTNP